MTNRPTSAFTLIELSIVLVIIGLIVGGVLVGQDLIRAAGIRATIAQTEKYSTAANTFRLKYNALPGDMLATNASAFGLFSMTGNNYFGDGNGRISAADSQNLDYGCTPFDPNNGSVIGGESTAFWRHLSDAQLIDGSYGKDLNNEGIPVSTDPGKTLPAAKIGQGNYLFPCHFTNGDNGFPYNLRGHYFLMIGLKPDYTDYATNTSPGTAYQIDLKIDDGKPNTGRTMVAHGDMEATNLAFFYFISWAASATANTCLKGGTAATDTAATYNAALDGNNPSCYGMMFKFQ